VLQSVRRLPADHSLNNLSGLQRRFVNMDASLTFNADFGFILYSKVMSQYRAFAADSSRALLDLSTRREVNHYAKPIQTQVLAG
jgi:hypothetical protein